MSRSTPPSPFGPPATQFNLDGWRFGAFLRSHDKELFGFFIDEIDLEARLNLYAQAVPGSSLSEAFSCIALPSPIRNLLEDFRPDWRMRGSTHRWACDMPPDERAMRTGPWRMGSNPNQQETSARFAWLAAPAPKCHQLETDEACGQLLALWRQELESQGIATAPWTGRSLLLLRNGHLGDEVLALAHAEHAACDGLLDRRLEREIHDPATRRISPRI